MTNILGDYQNLFLDETLEQIEELNQNLLELEKDNQNTEYIHEIFRAAHTLKSSSSFIGLKDMSTLAHRMESLLQEVRDGVRAVDTDLVNLLFGCFDVLNAFVRHIADKNEIPDYAEQFAAETAKIEAMLSGAAGAGAAPAAGAAGAATPTPTTPGDQTEAGEVVEAQVVSGPVETMESASVELALTDADRKKIRSALSGGSDVYDISIHLEDGTPMKGLRLTLVLQTVLRLEGSLLWCKPTELELDSGTDADVMRFLFATNLTAAKLRTTAALDMVKKAIVEPLDPAEVGIEMGDDGAGDESKPKVESAPAKAPGEPEAQSDAKSSPRTEDRTKSSQQKSVRVSTEKLDALINQVGELVIANSGFQKVHGELEGLLGGHQVVSEFRTRIDQMARIARDLQEVVMKTRMFPVGPVFQRFNRLVRDLSVDKAKKVRLDIRGEDTELDKEVIDLIGEPILHLIRNAIDHGLESPEERIAAGKKEEAVILLNSYQSGSQIFIEVADDGRGLNRDKIVKKAVDAGLTTEAAANSLDDNEVYQFIFEPGFSTADQITDISGRGVGMNVVRRMVQDFSGEILIESERGAGSQFTLVFPLTLAIISAILVRIGRERYALPLSEVIETIKVEKTEITSLENHRITNLRGEILPLFDLADVLNSQESGQRSGEGQYVDKDHIHIVVVKYNKRKAGLIVHEFLGKQEIVIKSIERNYRHIMGIAGAVITGDGSIMLILDIKGIIQFQARKSELSDAAEKGIDVESLLWNEHAYWSDSHSDVDVGRINSEIEKIRAEVFISSQPLEVDEEEGAAKNGHPATGRRRRSTDRLTVRSQGSPEGAGTKTATATSTRAIAEPSGSGEAVSRGNDALPGGGGTQSSESNQGSPSNRPTTTGPKTGLEHDSGSPVVPPGVGGGMAGTTPGGGSSGPNLENSERTPGQMPARDSESGDRAGGPAEDPGSTHNEQTESSGIQLDEQDFQKLTTLTRTSMANAGLVLSQILGHDIELTAPGIELHEVDELPNIVEGYTDVAQSGAIIEVAIQMVGALQGYLVSYFSQESANVICETLMGITDGVTDKAISEDAISALNEITNIISASVINTIADKTGLDIQIDVPQLSYTTPANYVNTIQNISTHVLFINTVFSAKESSITARFGVFPDLQGLKSILQKL